MGIRNGEGELKMTAETKKKNNSDGMLFAYIIIGLLLLSAISWYWSSRIISETCISEKGKAFCADLNMSFWGRALTINHDFQCYLDNNRTSVSHDYKYLDSELSECCRKDRYQFKMGCK
jgi:hypothetical protein